LAAALTLSSSPSRGWSPGWWQGIFQWWRSDCTLLAVNPPRSGEGMEVR
jgi:hypothetical protein